MQMATNYLGHFFLCELLTPLLRRARAESGRAVVVCVSSYAHFFAPRGGVTEAHFTEQEGYSRWKLYGASKLANVLHAAELNRRFEKEGGHGKMIALSLHPGAIPTELSRHFGGATGLLMKLIRPLVFKTIPEGAATQVYCALFGAEGGRYHSDCNVATCSSDAQDEAAAGRLWELGTKLLAAKGFRIS